MFVFINLVLGKRDVSQEQVAQLIEQLKLSWSNILQVTLQVAPLVVSGNFYLFNKIKRVFLLNFKNKKKSLR